MDYPRKKFGFNYENKNHLVTLERSIVSIMKTKIFGYAGTKYVFNYGYKNTLYYNNIKYF